MSTDENVLRLYQQFRNWNTNHHLSLETLLSLTTELIPVVEKMLKEEKGVYKKKVLMDTLKLIINDSPLQNSEKQLLLTVLHTTVSTSIDIMISIAKGEIDIGKKIKMCCNIC